MNEEKFIARNHCLKEHSNVKKTLIYSIRSFIFEKFYVWDWMDLFPYRFRMTYYDYIRPFFKPCNQKIRKVIPRTWMDVSHLNKYITKDRPQLQKDLETAYPASRLLDEMFKPIEDENGRKMFQMVDDGIPYEVKYKEVNRIEKLIDDIDTEILTEFIKRRHYFWT